MENPIDVLGVNPSGALERRLDVRDYPYAVGEIAQASEPFNWAVGYDVEADIATVLKTGFQLPTKNQGASGSCGGQAFAYYDQAVGAYYGTSPVERSAKYPYSQVFVGDVASGGGSSDRDLANIGIHQGYATEVLTPSYPSYGGAPTEQFMEQPQDITAQARLNAGTSRILSAYSFPQINIDIIAQAIGANKGCVLGIYGTNNGTWLSSEPVPPTATDKATPGARWAHYIYFGKAFMENGVKKVWGKQSWGPSAAPLTNGWQKLDQAYFDAGGVWSAITMLYNPAVLTPPQHAFSVDLKVGTTSSDVMALQQMLAYDGELTVAPTGYYGSITEQAVLKFQIKYQLATLATLDELGGSVVGPATRAKLNSLT